MSSRIRRVAPGEPISAALFNALVDSIERLGNLTGAFPIEVHRHPGGLHVALASAEREALARLTTALAPGGTATAQILWHDGSAWQDAETGAVELHDDHGNMAGVPGDRVLARFHRQSGRWIVWQPHGPIRRGRLDSPLSGQGSAACSLFAGPSGATVDTGENVTIHDWLLSPSEGPVAAGKNVLVALADGAWWLVAVGC